MNITLHIILIHFIYLYISICLYKSIRISLYFPTVFLRPTHGWLYSSLLRFYFLYSLLPSTVASLTVGSLYGFLYVFLYDFLYGYLYTVFSSFILYILYYLIFIFFIYIHCILNTIFYYILYFSPP